MRKEIPGSFQKERRMDFGMPTLIEVPRLADCAALCAEFGLQFVECNMNLPEYQTDKIDTAAFAEIARRYNIYYTLHLDENLNVCDFNSAVADAYLHTVSDAIRAAKLLNIPVLNMHLSDGVYFTLPDRKAYLFEQYRDRYLEKLKVFRDQCVRAIGEDSIQICIENCGGYQDFQRRGVDLLLESDCFALTFDVGHNHSAGNRDEAFLLDRRGRLCHMHLHDARREKNHLPLGTGELDLMKYLHLAKQRHCRVVLETKTVDGLKQSVEWLRKQEKRRDHAE